MGASRGVTDIRFCPLGVQTLSEDGGAEASLSFEGVVGFVDACVGVVGRIVVDGEDGDSGRRKGEARGEPKDSGEGL